MEQQRWRYVPELDAVRAVAITFVVLFHFLPTVFRGGRMGVTVFFVLSGYLITGLLSTEFANRGAVDRPAFYLRRFLRLYPLLVLAVLTVLVVSPLTGHAPFSTSRMYFAAGASLLYLNDLGLAASHYTAWLDPTWSLAVEEQFYLLWPLLLILGLTRWTPRTCGRLCLIGTAAFAVIDVVSWRALGDPATQFVIGSVMPLLLGCGAALARPKVPLWTVWPAAIVLVVLLLVMGESHMYYGPQQVAALAAGVGILALAEHGLAAMRHPALIWLGRRSYALYLIHAIFNEGLANAWPSLSTGLRAAIAIPASLLAAEVACRVVERPFLVLKQRFTKVPGEPTVWVTPSAAQGNPVNAGLSS